MKLVFVYGPPAAGKFTVSARVAEMTGLALFHNHLVVDTVASVFPFGSPSFVRLREQFWMDVFDAAVAEDRSLIFTFQPEGSVSPEFAQRVVDFVRGAGGEVLLVHLKLSADGQAARIANQDRARFGKLRDAGLLARLQAEFEACERAMPAADLVIDTEQVPVEAAAGLIAARLR
ncbi:MAG: shikimate kinase [Hyphomonas sp.]|jgi:cytidylate kinase|nr:shikimate kinase [Hyphomonas sp.]